MNDSAESSSAADYTTPEQENYEDEAEVLSFVVNHPIPPPKRSPTPPLPSQDFSTAISFTAQDLDAWLGDDDSEVPVKEIQVIEESYAQADCRDWSLQEWESGSYHNNPPASPEG